MKIFVHKAAWHCRRSWFLATWLIGIGEYRIDIDNSTRGADKKARPRRRRLVCCRNSHNYAMNKLVRQVAIGSGSRHVHEKISFEFFAVQGETFRSNGIFLYFNSINRAIERKEQWYRRSFNIQYQTAHNISLSASRKSCRASPRLHQTNQILICISCNHLINWTNKSTPGRIE